MSAFVVRAFTKMQETAFAHRELSQRFAELEKRLESHDEQIHLIVKTIKQFMARPEKPTKRIGFQVREKRVSYGQK